MKLHEALISSGQVENADEAKEIINEIIVRTIDEGEDPEDVLADYGLEPDYVMDIYDYEINK